MRYLNLILALASVTSHTLFPQTILSPAPISSSDLNAPPYRYNGVLWVFDGSGPVTGSASLVAPGVIATAAHLIFDEQAMQWVPVGNIRYYPRYHSTQDPALSNSPSWNFPGELDSFGQPIALRRWTSYSSRVESEDNPTESSIDTFNIDFAVGFFSSTITDPLITEHAQVHIDSENKVGILREDRAKIITGYPNSNPWLLNSHPASNIFALWMGLEELSSSQVDSGGFRMGIYKLFDVTTTAGASGGPVYVQDDIGNWLFSGIIVGVEGSDKLLVRAIDDNAYEWIEEAAYLRGEPTLQRVDNLEATGATRTEVTLEWTDHSSNEAGYKVMRQSSGTWEEIASLGPDAETFTDAAALPGQVYHYTVHPFDYQGNLAPKSREVQARTLGNNKIATTFLSQPWLQFTSRGDSGWYVDQANRLRSGKVNALESSSLMLEILGPGTLEFEWSISSDDDALYLYLNGAPAFDGGGKLFISGQKGPQSFTLPLPAGNSQVEWRYAKNAYGSSGEDAGFLHALSWSPNPANPYPVFGAFEFEGTEWHGSEWLGVYYTEFWPWVIHLELGWMAFTGTPDGWLIGSSTLQLPAPPYKIGTFYTNPSLFPYLYLPETNTWLYYYRGTGTWGEKAWFWNANTNQYMQTP